MWCVSVPSGAVGYLKAINAHKKLAKGDHHPASHARAAAVLMAALLVTAMAAAEEVKSLVGVWCEATDCASVPIQKH